MSKKRNLDKEVESLFDTMQEVFRDCDEQKRKIISSIKVRKKNFEAEDAEEEAKLGKLELDAYKLLNDVIDKKIKLLVIHSKIVGTKEGVAGNGDSDAPLSATEMKALAAIALGEAKKEINYDLNDK